ncbi:YlxR family protein [Mycoplasmopsis pulmonis]|nr:YlxR family RNase P modulator [Mycoplasmopsis pulmonis]MDZ7293170.1 YlxR family protein [Mycoplasmopsis pulmonis]
MIQSDNSKTLTRKCIVTGKIYSVSQLLRFYKFNDKVELQLGSSNKKIGRGAYVLFEKEKIDYLFQKRLLNRSFKKNISNHEYDYLKEQVEAIWQKKEIKD